MKDGIQGRKENTRRILKVMGEDRWCGLSMSCRIKQTGAGGEKDTVEKASLGLTSEAWTATSMHATTAPTSMYRLVVQLRRANLGRCDSY